MVIFICLLAGSVFVKQSTESHDYPNLSKKAQRGVAGQENYIDHGSFLDQSLLKSTFN